MLHICIYIYDVENNKNIEYDNSIENICSVKKEPAVLFSLGLL